MGKEGLFESALLKWNGDGRVWEVLQSVSSKCRKSWSNTLIGEDFKQFDFEITQPLVFIKFIRYFH